MRHFRFHLLTIIEWRRWSRDRTSLSVCPGESYTIPKKCILRTTILSGMTKVLPKLFLVRVTILGRVVRGRNCMVIFCSKRHTNDHFFDNEHSHSHSSGAQKLIAILWYAAVKYLHDMVYNLGVVGEVGWGRGGRNCFCDCSRTHWNIFEGIARNSPQRKFFFYTTRM